jgi:hypothetical protein
MSSPLRKQEMSPDMKDAFAKEIAACEARMARLPQIRAEGEAALKRLFDIANGHSGQCRYVAAFLLGLYNGSRFPFDLTYLRGVDYEIFDDCMTVLRMDYQPFREVHTYFDKGGQRFEALADNWGIVDMQRLGLDLE